MNSAIELHDSTIAVIFYSNDAAIVVFSNVYIHESDRPGWDAGSVWAQRAEMVIGNAAEVELPEAWPCEIAHGEYELSGIKHSNMIPLPFSHTGEFRIKLDVFDGHDEFRTIELSGQSAELTLLGEPRHAGNFLGAG
jgi:hypothetical protein